MKSLNFRYWLFEQRQREVMKHSHQHNFANSITMNRHKSEKTCRTETNFDTQIDIYRVMRMQQSLALQNFMNLGLLHICQLKRRWFHSIHITKIFEKCTGLSKTKRENVTNMHLSKRKCTRLELLALRTEIYRDLKDVWMAMTGKQVSLLNTESPTYRHNDFCSFPCIVPYEAK